MMSEEVKGLLQVKVSKIKSHLGPGTFNIHLRVNDQVYMFTTNLTDHAMTDVNETRMFDCNSNDWIELECSDINSVEGELRFPLKKLTQMPRVKHVIGTHLIKKRDKKNKKSYEIENLLDIELEIIFLNNVQGKLIIYSMQADLLNDSDLFGTIDPYVQVQFDDRKYNTKSKDNQGKHCTWSQKIQLDVRKGGKSTFKLKVFDRDLIKDDLGGEAEINLLKEGLLIPQEKVQERQFNLISNDSTSGTIKIQYQFKIQPFNF